MTILSVENGMSDGVLLIACIVIVAVAFLLSIIMVMVICGGRMDDITDWIVVAVSTILLGGLLCIFPLSDNHSPTKYKVIFESGIPESFYDDYKIIEQEGRIFTIQSIRKEE